MLWFLCLTSFSIGFYLGYFKVRKHKIKREESETENYMYLKKEGNNWKRVYGKFNEYKKTKK